jgi:hypothetical protein
MFYAAGALVIILNYREASVSVIAVHFYPGRKGTQGRAASFSPDHLAFSTRERSAAAAMYIGRAPGFQRNGRSSWTTFFSLFGGA